MFSTCPGLAIPTLAQARSSKVMRASADSGNVGLSACSVHPHIAISMDSYLSHWVLRLISLKSASHPTLHGWQHVCAEVWRKATQAWQAVAAGWGCATAALVAWQTLT